MNKVIVITGQTATGKTSLALKYAKKQKGELINADSRQIYKKLDIVTGKDLKKLQVSKIPLHLFDIVDPKEDFSSFDYVKKVQTVIKDVIKREKTPIIVGGTYFYIQQLLYGHDTEGIGADPELRKKLNTKTVPELQDILSHLFKQMKQTNTMNQSDWSNPRRLIRKIEILSSGKHAKKKSGLTDEYNIELIGLRFSKKESLVDSITPRVEDRVAQGAVTEVKNLLKEGYTTDDPGLKTIGYKQLISYLLGEHTREEALKEWIAKEIQYAKRQYTFMKKDANIRWLEVF